MLLERSPAHLHFSLCPGALLHLRVSASGRKEAGEENTGNGRDGGRKGGGAGRVETKGEVTF